MWLFKSYFSFTSNIPFLVNEAEDLEILRIHTRIFIRLLFKHVLAFTI